MHSPSYYNLSTKVNKYVPVNRWVASLSNGRTIYQDERPGEISSWRRLGQYVENTNLSITNLRLQIKINGRYSEIKLPPGAEGYIYKNSAWATFQSNSIGKAIGYIQGDLALIYHAGSARDSKTERGVIDPGPPFTIYRRDIRELKNAVTI